MADEQWWTYTVGESSWVVGEMDEWYTPFDAALVSAPTDPERQATLDYLHTLTENMPVVVLTPRSKLELELVENFIQKLEPSSPWRSALGSKLTRMKTWADENFGGRSNAPRNPPPGVSLRLMGAPICEGDEDAGSDSKA